MVRSLKVCLLACMMVIAFAIPLQASTSPYEGTISDSYKSIFSDTLADVSLFDNYVFWRSGEYQYSMLVGDIVEDNGTFSVSGGEMYVLDIINIDGSAWASNSYHRFTHYLDIDYTLTSDNFLVYSDIKGYPKLEERGITYEFITAFLVLCTIIGTLVWRIFKFLLRERSIT